MLYLSLFFLVVVFNLMPGFMPPTWTVLAYFSLQHHALPLPLIVIGVLGATIGRIGLYFLSRLFGRRLFSLPSRQNFNDLGAFLNTNKKYVLLSVLGYAFVPLPSNQLFITAGLAKVHLMLLSVSFIIGRAISYTVMVFLTGIFFTRLYSTLGIVVTKQFSVVIEIVGFIIIYAVSRINWKSLLSTSKKK